jgi:hypothetical protein
MGDPVALALAIAALILALAGLIFTIWINWRR